MRIPRCRSDAAHSWLNQRQRDCAFVMPCCNRAAAAASRAEHALSRCFFALATAVEGGGGSLDHGFRSGIKGRHHHDGRARRPVCAGRMLDFLALSTLIAVMYSLLLLLPLVSPVVKSASIRSVDLTGYVLTDVSEHSTINHIMSNQRHLTSV